MFYNQNFSNALLKFIMRFIHSVTDLYSAAIRFEREFADDFGEPAPSASPGEEAIEEATEEATGESPCARGIPELPVPVVSQRHRFRPSRRHPHVRPAAQRTHSIYWSVWSWTRGEPTATGRWPASATRLPSIVDGVDAQKSAVMKTASTQTDSMPSHIHTDENVPVLRLYAASPDAEPSDLLPFEYDPPTPLSSENDDESSTYIGVTPCFRYTKLYSVLT